MASTGKNSAAHGFLTGPRGRRLLLEYALESERIAGLDELDG